jgi:hypothetical protein
MATAPRALQIGDTVYRMDEISWVKFLRLTRLEQVARWSLFAAGVLFFIVVADGKNTYVNLEGLIGLFSIIAALQIAAGNRIASSGDLDETYQDHRIRSTDKLGPLLKEHNPDLLELSSPQHGYHYYIQASRIAWCSPWSSINFGPIWVIAIFGLYYAILHSGIQLPDAKPFDQVELFRFKSGLQSVKSLAILNIVLSIFAIVTSFQSGLRLAAVGGVSDGLPLTTLDRQKLVNYLVNAGNSEVKRVEAPVAVVSKPAPPPPAEPTSAPAEPEPAPAASESAVS